MVAVGWPFRAPFRAVHAVKDLSSLRPFLLAMICPAKREGRCPLG